MVLAVVLDLDGTLLDHAVSARSAPGEWLGALGPAATEEVAAAWFAAEVRHFRAWRDDGVPPARQAAADRPAGGAGPLFTSEALGVAKPDPRTFHLVCEALGLTPEQVLHVGDDHALDVVAARAACLPTVRLDRSSGGPLADGARITSLADLPDHLDV